MLRQLYLDERVDRSNQHIQAPEIIDCRNPAQILQTGIRSQPKGRIDDPRRHAPTTETRTALCRCKTSRDREPHFIKGFVNMQRDVTSTLRLGWRDKPDA
jgi:hypothetical protein